MKISSIFSISALLSTMCLSLSMTCNAQDYYPSDKWPYMFEDFTEATIHIAGKINDITAKANICLDSGRLHHNENGTILETSMDGIETVRFGNTTYVYTSGRLMEVLLENENGRILKGFYVSETAEGVDIGYGIKSQTIAAQNLDLLSTSGLSAGLLHAKIAEAILEKDYGNPLTIEEKTYLQTNGQLIPAAKKNVQDAIGKDKTTAFLKENKIKWDSTESLAKVLGLLKANL